MPTVSSVLMVVRRAGALTVARMEVLVARREATIQEPPLPEAAAMVVVVVVVVVAVGVRVGAGVVVVGGRGTVCIG